MMKRLLAALLALLPFATVYGGTEDELLEPDLAFSLSTRVSDSRTLAVDWKIAPGYYMYRDKFKFEPLDNDVVFKSPVIPPGKKKKDPLFGTVETYTKAVSIRLPIERRPSGALTARLRITGQGCNEPIGVCYPPIIKEVSFALPPVKAQVGRPRAPTTGAREPTTTVPSSLTGLTRAVRTASGQEEEVVDPERAFFLSVEGIDRDNLVAHFDIADCCYLYRDKMRFELAPLDGAALPAAVRLGSYSLPPGKKKTDDWIGETEVYHGAVDVMLRLEGVRGNTPPLALRVTYQGCSEKGVTICYPPMIKRFSVKASDGKLALTALSDGLARIAAAPGSDTTSLKRIDTRKFVLSVLAAFGIGLLLTFTPCVLPMIPILSSVIVGSTDRHITKLEGGLLSLSYVLGTAVTYTTTGVVAGATGEQLQAYFQNTWTIGIFSALFVLLALSMFGFYELQMPAFIQSFLHAHSSRVHARVKHVKGGAFLGIFFMGMLSALVVGACVSPLFISALGVAIANRDPVLGGAIMFSMALGMGVILIAIGVGAGFLLPRAGPWMNRVKQVFGVMLLGVAIYLLGFLPEVPVLLLWAALFIVIAVYMGATETLPKGASGWRYLWKGAGTVVLVWGVLALMGGLAGNRDILNPLPLSLTGGGVGTGPIAGGVAEARLAQPLFAPVRTLAELDAQLARARAAGRPAMLDYYATWCTDCVRMEKSTFRDSRVQRVVRSSFVALQADVTDPNDPEARGIKRRFGVYGPPAMLFFDTNGEERRDLRTYGYKSPQDLLNLLDKVQERQQPS